MRMSTKGRFAVNAMIDLALREQAGPVALAAISNRQQISLSYLEQLFSRLRRQGLVESTRGPGGGYTLGRKVGDITVADIVTAVDEPLDLMGSEVGSGESCNGAVTQNLWSNLNDAMLKHMARISLASLVEEQTARGVVVEAKPVRRAIATQPVVKPVRTNAPNSVFAFGRSFAR
jgi:Rrf2 family transcriptional regulator, iron-sulfur cluster assembly transcription factor